MNVSGIQRTIVELARELNVACKNVSVSVEFGGASWVYTVRLRYRYKLLRGRNEYHAHAEGSGVLLGEAIDRAKDSWRFNRGYDKHQFLTPEPFDGPVEIDEDA